MEENRERQEDVELTRRQRRRRRERKRREQELRIRIIALVVLGCFLLLVMILCSMIVLVIAGLITGERNAEALQDTLTNWLDRFRQEPGAERFLYTAYTPEERIYTVTVNYLFDGKLLCGYQVFLQETVSWLWTAMKTDSSRNTS